MDITKSHISYLQLSLAAISTDFGNKSYSEASELFYTPNMRRDIFEWIVDTLAHKLSETS